MISREETDGLKSVLLTKMTGSWQPLGTEKCYKSMEDKKPRVRKPKNGGFNGDDGSGGAIPHCSFCLRSANEVTTLISAPYGSAFICDICSANNVELLRSHLPQYSTKANVR